MGNFVTFRREFTKIVQSKLKSVLKANSTKPTTLFNCGGRSDYSPEQLASNAQKHRDVADGNSSVAKSGVYFSGHFGVLPISGKNPNNTLPASSSVAHSFEGRCVNNLSQNTQVNPELFVHKFRRIVDCINSGCKFRDVLYNLHTDFWSLKSLGIVFPGSGEVACREIVYIIIVSFISDNLKQINELLKEPEKIIYSRFYLWISKACRVLYDFQIQQRFCREVVFSENSYVYREDKKGKLTIYFTYTPYNGKGLVVQTKKFDGSFYHDKDGEVSTRLAHRYVSFAENPVMLNGRRNSALEVDSCLLLTANMAEFMYRVRKNTSFSGVVEEKKNFYKAMLQKDFPKYLKKFDFNVADNQKPFQKVAPTLYFTGEFEETEGRMTFFSCIRLIVESMEKTDMVLANFMLYKARGRHSMLFTIEKHHEFNSGAYDNGQVVNNVFYKVYIYDSYEGNKLSTTILQRSKFENPNYSAKVNKALLTSVPSLLSLYGLHYNSYSLGFRQIKKDNQNKLGEILGLSYMHPLGESNFIKVFDSFPTDTYKPILRDNNIKSCIDSDIKSNKFEGILAVIFYENNVELAEMVFDKKYSVNLYTSGLKIWQMACCHIKLEKILQLIEECLGFNNGKNSYSSWISDEGVNLFLIALRAKNYVAAKFLLEKGCTLKNSNYKNDISKLKEDKIIMEICKSAGYALEIME